MSLPASALRAALRSVHGIAKVLAGLEADVLRSGDLNLFVGAGIAAFARLALADRETAQTGNGAALSPLARLGDVVDEGIKCRRGFFLRNAGLFGDRIDDVTLSCHKRYPPLQAEK